MEFLLMDGNINSINNVITWIKESIETFILFLAHISTKFKYCSILKTLILTSQYTILELSSSPEHQ